jgi:hypothetical protein
LSNNRVITAVCGVVAAAVLIGTGAAFADASTRAPTAATSTASTASAPAVPGTGCASAHTPVTGSELRKVTQAVKAKKPSLAVSHVRRDPDGSYDVFGTTSGTPVRLEVSKDLKAISTRTDDGHRGPGGPGAPWQG